MKNNRELENVSGRGRKRATTQKEDRQILREVKVNSQVSIKQILSNINATKEKKISHMTVRRRLQENNVKAYVVRKKPAISKKNKSERLKFALEHRNKPLDFWKKILWTDESTFSLDGTYGRKYYFSTPEDKKYRSAIRETRSHQGGKLMIWGCIYHGGVGPLVKLPEKVTQHTYLQVLNEVALVAGSRLIEENFILQEDNAPIHKSRMIKKFLKDIGQNVIQWPPQSPDLNIIENLWHYLKLHIPERLGKSKQEAWEDIKDTWSQIPSDYVMKLFESIPRRLQEVIDAKGGNTSY